MTKIKIFPANTPIKDEVKRVGIGLMQDNGDEVAAYLTDENGCMLNIKPFLLRFKLSPSTGRIYVSRDEWANPKYCTLDGMSARDRIRVW